jgi:hypothetical protein
LRFYSLRNLIFIQVSVELKISYPDNAKIITQLKCILLTVASLAAFAISSCDPTYPISILNSKSDTVTIVTETTVNFYSNDELINYQVIGGPYDHQVVQFQLPPGNSVTCGMAIAGIEDEMPFTKFKAYDHKDSVTANSQEEILNLFDKTFWGSVKTPYQLTIK